MLVHNSAVWSIFPDHSAVIAGIRVPVLPRLQMQWRFPGHIPWDQINQEQWQSAPDLGPILNADSPHEGGSDSVTSTTTTEAFRSWSQKFEQQVVASFEPRIVKADTSFQGRGLLDRPQPRLVSITVPKHSRDGEVRQVSGFLNRAVSRWFKQLRRLQSYLHAIKSDRADETFISRAQLWHSILVAEGFKGGFRVWWHTRPCVLQGGPSNLPDYPPNQVAAQAIYDDFLQNYRRFEHWQFSKRQASCAAKLLSTTKGLYAATRRPAKESLDCLVDNHDQPITVIDAMSGRVSVPYPFSSSNMIHWTLQDQPAIVESIADAETEISCPF